MATNRLHGARALHLDIETAPNQVFTWGLFNQNISLNKIVEPGYTLCYAAKWDGDKSIKYDGLDQSTREEMAESLWHLLDEADLVVTYNGQKFDLPTVQKDFVMSGMHPPSPFKQIDLYKAVKQNFKFTSGKLDFVAQQLGLGKKTEHTGFDLWKRVMDNDPKAWALMKKYNKQDVKLTEQLYWRIRGWIKNHPNLGLYVDEGVDNQPVCRNCGSTHLVKNGVERTNVQKYQRYRCQDCGAPHRGRLRLEAPGKGILV